MDRRSFVGIFGVGSLPLLAGCTSSQPTNTAQQTETSSKTNGPINSIDIQIVDGTRSFVVKYDIGEYASVLLETDDGTVVSEETASPDGNEVVLPYQAMEGGDYKFLFRREGDTVASTEKSFSGPDVSLSSITGSWDANDLKHCDVTIDNSGDMPVRLESAVLSALTKQSLDYELSGFVREESSETVMLEIREYLYVFEEAGEVETSVEVETSSGRFSASTTHELTPGTPEFAEIRPVWNGNNFNRVEVTLSNVGDVPRKVYFTASSSETTITSPVFNIDPGEETSREPSADVGERLYEDADADQVIEVVVTVYDANDKELISKTVTTSSE